MKRLNTIVMACGLLTAGSACLLQAGEWNKETHLTIAHELQIGDTVLMPGQCLLKVAESNSERDVVQIFSGDGERLKAIILGVPTYRLEPTGKSEFTISGAITGQPATLRAWFYPGDNFGLAFPVVKQRDGAMPKVAGKSQVAGQQSDTAVSGR